MASILDSIRNRHLFKPVHAYEHISANAAQPTFNRTVRRAREIVVQSTLLESADLFKQYAAAPSERLKKSSAYSN